MLRRLLKESLIVLAGTLFFLMLSATVGISTSKLRTAPTAKADEHYDDSEEVVHEYSPASSPNHANIAAIHGLEEVDRFEELKQWVPVGR